MLTHILACILVCNVFSLAAMEQQVDAVADGASAIHQQLANAVVGGELEEIERLLGEGADIYARFPITLDDEHGKLAQPLLHLAVYGAEQKLEILEKLVQKGLTADVTDEDGLTVLHVAAQVLGADDVDILNYLLTLPDANVNAQDKAGNTALHFATSREAVKALCDKGALIDVRNNKQETPLFVALKAFQMEAASELNARGSDPLVADAEGNTPATYWRGKYGIILEKVQQQKSDTNKGSSMLGSGLLPGIFIGAALSAGAMFAFLKYNEGNY